MAATTVLMVRLRSRNCRCWPLLIAVNAWELTISQKAISETAAVTSSTSR